MPSQAEHLPREIWLYIFTFFEGHDLVRTFSHLNSFFDSLLRSPHLQLHIRIKKHESNQRLPQVMWSHIDLQTIYSLSVGRRTANCLIQFLRWHARHLTRLRSLSVYLKMSTIHENIQFLMFALQQISSLTRISIKSMKLSTDSSYLNPLMIYIFRENSTINNCSLIFRSLDGDIKTSKLNNNLNLKYLHITGVSWFQLFSILPFTPQLHALKATMQSCSILSPNTFTLSQLRKVDLYFRRLPFAQLPIVKQAAPNLQSLQLRGCFDANDDDYFNGKLWHTLFRDIKYFNVKLSAVVNDDTTKQIVKSLIRDCQEKEWFKVEEKGRFIKVSVIIKSLAV